MLLLFGHMQSRLYVLYYLYIFFFGEALESKLFYQE